MIKKVMEDYKVLLRSIPAATVSLSRRWSSPSTPASPPPMCSAIA